MMLDAKLPARLRSLLDCGYAPDAEGGLSALLCGLAHPAVEPGQRGWVVSRLLLAQRQALSSDDELVMALLALLPDVRNAWLAIIAARCQEAAQMTNNAPLVQLITALQGAAGWVEAALPVAQLAASPYAAIERELLGASAEQAAATPMLVRVLAAGFALHQAQAEALPALPGIDADGVQAAQNWTAGRLLALPQTRAEADYVLSGMMAPPATASTLAWVIATPWALLLAMVVYAQYNWAAEARGGLVLAVSAGQQAFCPSEISVRVQGPEGDETRCGTLAGLLLRALAHLGVSCFPQQPQAGQLDAQLASLVGLMLAQSVWRYQDGASGQDGEYLIHPVFADACFRLPGSKVFNRTGRHLWQAIRITAEQWRSELRSIRRERGLP